MTAHDFSVFLVALAFLLAAALILGELARMVRQPAVLGEILAGILLGETVLGRVAPSLYGTLFPDRGNIAIAINSFTNIAVVLFMLVAGMELDLSTIWRQGRVAMNVGLAGIVVPFGLGFAVAWINPRLMGQEYGSDRLIFALFIATAFSISALPVIAKTLIDINLYRSDLGMIIVAAAILNDLVGWIIFALILGLMGKPAGAGLNILQTIALTLGFAVFMLTMGRWLVHRLIPWIQAYVSWPAGILGFSFILALLCAAFTEWVGVHAIFGSFLVGVVIGDSSHLREQTRTTLRQFISFIFAPLFFASIGLYVDFIASFRWQLVLIVLVVATLGKLIGCEWGARRIGMERRESWAVAFGLNARGAMEIILGMLALQHGVIRQRLFVALVVMALFTSMMSGPVMSRLLKRRTRRRFYEFIQGRTFVSQLRASSREGVLVELSKVAAEATGLSADKIQTAVLAREALMPTGLSSSVAVPHARINGMTNPVLVLGLSREGIDFDSPDGKLARIIFLILTPPQQHIVQLEILTDIANVFSDEDTGRKVLHAENYVQFLALMKTIIRFGEA